MTISLAQNFFFTFCTCFQMCLVVIFGQNLNVINVGENSALDFDQKCNQTAVCVNKQKLWNISIKAEIGKC